MKRRLKPELLCLLVGCCSFVARNEACRTRTIRFALGLRSDNRALRVPHPNSARRGSSLAGCPETFGRHSESRCSLSTLEPSGRRWAPCSRGCCRSMRFADAASPVPPELADRHPAVAMRWLTPCLLHLDAAFPDPDDADLKLGTDLSSWVEVLPLPVRFEAPAATIPTARLSRGGVDPAQSGESGRNLLARCHQESGPVCLTRLQLLPSVPATPAVVQLTRPRCEERPELQCSAHCCCLSPLQILGSCA